MMPASGTRYLSGYRAGDQTVSSNNAVYQVTFRGGVKNRHCGRVRGIVANPGMKRKNNRGLKSTRIVEDLRHEDVDLTLHIR